MCDYSRRLLARKLCYVLKSQEALTLTRILILILILILIPILITDIISLIEK